jgi:hypothetical protein
METILASRRNHDRGDKQGAVDDLSSAIAITPESYSDDYRKRAALRYELGNVLGAAQDLFSSKCCNRR